MKSYAGFETNIKKSISNLCVFVTDFMIFEKLKVTRKIKRIMKSILYFTEKINSVFNEQMLSCLPETFQE